MSITAAGTDVPLSINQLIKPNLYCAMRRKRIRGAIRLYVHV